MPSTRTEITVLLMIEAMDKASGLIGGLGKTLDNLGAKIKEMGGTAVLTGDELEAAQLKAIAAEDAHRAALDEQNAAMERLRITSTSLRQSQEALAATDMTDAKAASDAAKIVQVASADQVAALDAVRKAEDSVAERAAYMADAQKKASTESDATGIGLSQVGKVAMATSVAVAAIGYESVKSAANFQAATTVLMTSGGQTQATIEKTRQDILSLSASTGTSTQQLINAMYQIGSAGIKTSQQYDTLKAAAQGAKAENADLGTVANALTTIMVNYGDKIKGGPIQAMNEMITVVQNGKMTTQDLSSSLSAVLPIAHSAGLSFEQVGGAIATMTRQGMSAQQSTQDLAHMIGQLQKPNQQAIQMMQQMGVDSNKLSNDLGKNGLTGTMNTLLQAIANNTHNGKIMLQDWYNSSAAAKDLKVMLGDMTPAMQQVANAFMNGSITAKEYRNDLYAMPPLQRNVMTQFMTLADKANGFNQMLKAGNPDAMTFNAALSTMLGGSTSLKTALMLTANQGQDLNSIVGKVGAASQKTGSDVNGWALIQQTMNQKLAELKASANVAAIQLGTALLPMVTKLLDWVMKIVEPIANWIGHNKTLAATLLAIIGVIGVVITTFIAVMKVITLLKESWIAFTAITEATEFNPVIAAITLIAVVALLIITHWSTVKKWIEEFWGWLKKTAEEAWNFIKSHVNMVAGALALLGGPIGMLIALVLEIVMHWKQVKAFFEGLWKDIKGGAQDVANFFKGIWGDISKPLTDEWKHISDDLSSIWDSLTTIWNATGGKLVALIARHWDEIKDGVRLVWNLMAGWFKSYMTMISGYVKGGWDIIQGIFHVAWDLISGIVKMAWDIIYGIIKGSLTVIMGVLQTAWDAILAVIKIVWEAVKTTINTVLDAVKDILKFFADLVTGQWGKLWGDFEKIFKDAWNNIWSFLKSIGSTIGNFVVSLVSNIWGSFIRGINDALGGVWNALIELWNTFIRFFKDAGTWLYNAGRDILTGFINGLKSMWGDVQGFFSDITSAITSWKGPPSKDKILLVQNGQLVMQGFITGIDSQIETLKKKLSQVTGTVTTSINPVVSGGNSSLSSVASARNQGNVQVNFSFPNSQIAGPNSINWIMQQINKQFVQKAVPTAGIQIPRATY